MVVLAEKKRDWDYVRDESVIAKLIFEKLQVKSLFLKHSIPPAEFYVIQDTEEGVELSFTPDLELDEMITLYLTVKRQVEFDFRMVRLLEPGSAIFQPVVARIGKAIRTSPRYDVGDERVIVTNFRISKNQISPNNTKLQITNRVIFSDYEKRLSKQYSGLHILTATDKSLPAFAKNYTEQLPSVVSDSSGHHLVAPIVYSAEASPVTLAYLFFPVPDAGALLPAQLEELAQDTEQMVQRVVDANTVTIKDKQMVVNISEGGIAILIDNEELIKYLPHQKWLTFDVIFKMQAPIRLRGEIRHMEQLPEGIQIGISFQGLGHSDFRKGNQQRLKALIGQLTGA